MNQAASRATRVNRPQAAQRLADWIREKFGLYGYVIEMSGTPSPKSPLDWRRQMRGEAWPGFLKEGSQRALEQRCGFVVMQQYDTGTFPKRIGWKDDDRKQTLWPVGRGRPARTKWHY